MIPVTDREEMEESDTTGQSFDACPPVSVYCSANSSLNCVEAEGCSYGKQDLSHDSLIDETNLSTLPSHPIPVKHHQATVVSDFTFKDHTYLNFSQKKSAPKDSVTLRLERRKYKQIMTKKPNNRDTDHMYNTRKANTVDKTLPKPNNRDTDHLYNTRKTETVDENLAKKANIRDTDHMYNTSKARTVDETLAQKTNRDTELMYNTRKTEHVEETSSRKLNNRDTDHMYNMRKAETVSHDVLESVSCMVSTCTASAERNETSDCTTVDKRVVDKDHMYQHNVRKLRNKSEQKGIAVSANQHQSPSGLVTTMGKKKRKRRRQLASKATGNGLTHQGSLDRETIEDEGDTVPPNKLVRTESGTGTCRVKLKEKIVQESERDRKVCSVFIDCDTTACPLTEHGYTSVQIKGSSVLDPCSILSTLTSTTATKPSSPAHSDNDSDHTYEDDSRRTSVFHTDHMYVHADYLDTDILDQAKGPIMTECFSSEGYKQEHSYANSEEIRYDACKNCSELVQQLIGTIHRQRNHIDDLRKQLQVTNAKNKQLSLMFSRHSEDVN